MFDFESGFRVFQAYSEGPFEPESTRFVAQGLTRFIAVLLIAFVFVASLLYVVFEARATHAPAIAAGVKADPAQPARPGQS